MKITVRKGNQNDIESIYNLVVELAVFEREPDAVTATLADYNTAFNDGRIFCLVAENDNQIIGMMIYYYAFSTWKGKMMYLEDFYVREAYRSQKVGDRLFDAFIEHCNTLGCILTKWQVLDWNQRAQSFYKRKGATIEQNWYNGKLYL